MVTPTGWRENGLPATILFTGRLYDEATVLCGDGLSEATEFHLAHPKLEECAVLMTVTGSCGIDAPPI